MEGSAHTGRKGTCEGLSHGCGWTTLSTCFPQSAKGQSWGNQSRLQVSVLFSFFLFFKPKVHHHILGNAALHNEDDSATSSLITLSDVYL